MPFFWRKKRQRLLSLLISILQKPLAIASMIALQVVRMSFGFHSRECMGSCLAELIGKSTIHKNDLSLVEEALSSALEPNVIKGSYFLGLYLCRLFFCCKESGAANEENMGKGLQCSFLIPRIVLLSFKVVFVRANTI